jgi:hypothetical protein
MDDDDDDRWRFHQYLSAVEDRDLVNYDYRKLLCLNNNHTFSQIIILNLLCDFSSGKLPTNIWLCEQRLHLPNGDLWSAITIMNHRSTNYFVPVMRRFVDRFVQFECRRQWSTIVTASTTNGTIHWTIAVALFAIV